jgi:glucose/arabinose dehydrogenase
MKESLLLSFLALVAQPLFSQNPVRVQLIPWAQGVGSVTDIATNGDGRLYVASKEGVVRIVVDSMQVLPTPFLDISANTLDVFEMGLLGLAFDPDYVNNGRFYVHYMHNGAGSPSRISRFQVSADPNIAMVLSEQVIYSIPSTGPPYHKGGDIEFGPDGMLYISVGDGFTGANAQDLSDPYGDILRIDVSGATYAIPPDNPFINAGPDTLPQIWASGFRNPFRMGFDSGNGDLWIGDVGQSAWEEIDRIAVGDASGPNFGWPCYEANATYSAPDCATGASYVPPVVAVGHAGSNGDFCAIIGGRVYHGTQWPHFADRYFYTDYCQGDIRNLRSNGLGGWVDEISFDTLFSGASCIVENDEGELFLGNAVQDAVYRLVDRCPMDPPVIVQDGNMLSTDSAASIQWYFESALIVGATDTSYVPAASGNVHVVVDFGNGCILSSDTLSFVPMDLRERARSMVLLAPNPANDILQVTALSRTVARYHVLDHAGRIVAGEPIQESRFGIPVRALGNGTYVVEFFSAYGDLIARERFNVVH